VLVYGGAGASERLGVGLRAIDPGASLPSVSASFLSFFLPYSPSNVEWEG